MNQLLDEVKRLPAGAADFARDVSQVWTPDHLVPLRNDVRKEHGNKLRQLHAAINERFGTSGAVDDYINVFYAASEMALMEHVARDDLLDSDRRLLRQLWDRLLAADGE